MANKEVLFQNNICAVILLQTKNNNALIPRLTAFSISITTRNSSVLDPGFSLAS